MATIFRQPLSTKYEGKSTRAVVAVNSFIDNLGDIRLILQGQDTMFGAPGQVPGYTTVQPRYTIYPEHPYAYNRITLLTTAGAVPFNFTDWKNPSGYVFSVGLRTHIFDLAGTPLGALNVKPFNFSDWQNPRGYVPGVITNRTLTNTLATSGIILTGTKPFKQAEWPVPKGYNALPRSDYFIAAGSALLNSVISTAKKRLLMLLGIGS